VTGLDARQTALARANELLDGARSPNPLIRAAFLRALGRLETPADVATILPFLGDRADGVRLEAANALAQVLHDPDAEAYGKWSPLATEAIRAFLPNEQDGGVHGMMLRALGEIRHDPGRAAEIMALLLRSAQVALPATSSLTAKQLGAIEGIEALVRHHPDVRIDPDTRRAIRKLAVPSFGFEGDTGPFLPALQALVMLRDDDVSTVLAAAMFRCSQARRWSADARRPDCGWEVRRLGLQLMRGALSQYESVLRQASKDPSFRVRMEAMRVYARDVPVSRVCQPVMDFLLDDSPFVVMDALTKLDETCLDRDTVVDRVQRMAGALADPLKVAAWHIPVVALETLARFEPGAARKLATEHALTHPIWQVRTAVARVAAALEDESLAFQLAYDDEPNVRAEALSALYRLKSSATGIVAIDALSARGKYRPNSLVVYTAALVLRGSPAGAAAVAPLLKRLVSTAGSREARLEIVKRLSEFATPEEKLIAQIKSLFEPPLRRFLTVHEVSEEPETEDQREPLVTRALADLIGKLTGVRPDVPALAAGTGASASGQPCFYLETELVTPRIGILANRLEAPITTALFSKLVLEGKFDGTTFHRVFPNNYILGGSPRGNDYSDPGPDVRAEVGPLRHTRGSVAILHRERHAGHMQLFINLVDAPHLNRDFTVFGQVGRCQLTDPDPAVMMDAIDRLMEGATIVKMYPHEQLR
jgi:cyclophilin family peptidyl-prolyl cis-trans isomerase/HEAT repeat protein